MSPQPLLPDPGLLVTAGLEDSTPLSNGWNKNSFQNDCILFSSEPVGQNFMIVLSTQ